MENVIRENIRQFLRLNSTGKKVLNVGAGDRQYREYFPNQVTLDAAQCGSTDIVGDIHTIRIQGKYDVILCTQALEHFYDPQRALDNMRRALNPGGKLIMTVPLIYPLHEEPHDYFRFTEHGLRHLLREWNGVEITPQTHRFGTLGAMIQTYGLSELRIPGARLAVQVFGKIVSGLPSRNRKYTVGYLVTATKGAEA